MENLQDDSQVREPPATNKQPEEFVPEKVKQTSRPKINWKDLQVTEEQPNQSKFDKSEEHKDLDDFMPGEPVTVKLTEVINTTNSKIRIPDSLRHKFDKDPFFKIILDQPNNFPNFEVIDGLIFLKSNGNRLLCIPDISIDEKSLRMSLI